MTWTSIWYAIASFYDAMFRIWKSLGQKPNMFICTFIFCCLVYWALQMVKQSKEAKKNGTYP